MPPMEVIQTSQGFIKTKVTGDTAIMSQVEDFSNRLPRHAYFSIVDEPIVLQEKFRDWLSDTLEINGVFW